MSAPPRHLDPLARVGAGPFALLHRPDTIGPAQVELLSGPVRSVPSIGDLPVGHAGPGGHDLIALLPYRQIRERGYACHDDGETLQAMIVRHAEVLDREALLATLPRRRVELIGGGFRVDDDAYAETVRRVLREEIGTGAGSNFVVHRSFTATVDHEPVAAALAMFRRLLLDESGAYWTFLVHTGTRTLVGASPERHLSVRHGVAVMNPISGTYRYPTTGPTLPGVLEFLDDPKETDELFMVVDEELKMLGRVCDRGATVVGPHLRPMGRVAHTEYFVEGPTSADPRTVLRETMFAPTVTGSPLENAFRVVARHEQEGRGFYSGVLALFGRDEVGAPALDSTILIRTADLGGDGRLSIGVGATLVRHSEPDAEVAETRAKAAGVLGATSWGDTGTGTEAGGVTVAGTDVDLGVELGGETGADTGADPEAEGAARPTGTTPRALAEHPQVVAALRRRNDALARFWLESPDERIRPRPELDGSAVTVVDAEDTFTTMLAHQLRALGCVVRIVEHGALVEDDLHTELVVLGPGPGDPTDLADPKVRALHVAVTDLLARRAPLLAVCLSHQVLAGSLGLDVRRRPEPHQGLRREIDLFGAREPVGFYNTFAAYAPPTDRPPGLPPALELSTDPSSGEVHALRGPTYAGIQFHPESVLTAHGPDILAALIGHLRAAAAPPIGLRPAG